MTKETTSEKTIHVESKAHRLISAANKSTKRDAGWHASSESVSYEEALSVAGISVCMNIIEADNH